MTPPLSTILKKGKQVLNRLRISVETALVISVVLVVSSLSYTAYLAYQSLIQLTEVVSKGSESEVKMLLIKGVSNDLTGAESNIKSYGLSKEKAYLGAYQTSLKNVRFGMHKLDSLIPAGSKQQRTLDSVSVYVQQKTDYLQEFVRIQQRGSVVNELNVLTTQIEQNKKLLAYYLGDQDDEVAKEQEADEPSFLKRVFKARELKEEELNAKLEEQKEATGRLSNQIQMMEKVKGEIGQVKRRQGSTLKDIDDKELSITQKHKVLNEKLNAYMVSLEMDEMAQTRRIIEDIDKRHNRTDKLIGVFSLMGAVFLVIIGFVVSIFIKRKNSYQAALVDAKNQAEKYSLLQEQFLANMSHEIRTPMNAISGFTDQLLKTPLQEKQYSYLRIVQQSVGYLVVIINDILDYAKLKADKLTVEHIPFSVTQVLTDALLLLGDSASNKGIRTSINISTDIPHTVISDPIRLKQIMLNLLGNAVKFTTEGEVVVNLKCVNVQPHSSTIEITVKDTGIGISEKNIGKIFNAFEQAELSTARNYGGSGLGLSITQKLVELLHGKISIQSKEGVGTEVTMVFEWATSAPQQEKPTTDQVAFSMDSFASLVAGKCILIADDEEWNSTLLSTILESYNANYLIAQNGREAIDIVSSRDVDIVLMDVRMPDIDGFEATREIRKGAKAGIPIIGITADMTARQINLCYESGMNAVLGKPFTELQLGEMLHQVLSPSTEPKHSPTHLPDVKQTEASSKQPYSIAVLEEMGGGDPLFTIKMLRIFMQNGKKTLEQMSASIEQKRYTEVADAAHKMLPSARQLEADELLSLLKQMEEKTKTQQTDGLDVLFLKAHKAFEEIYNDMEKIIKQLEK